MCTKIRTLVYVFTLKVLFCFRRRLKKNHRRDTLIEIIIKPIKSGRYKRIISTEITMILTNHVTSIHY